MCGQGKPIVPWKLTCAPNLFPSREVNGDRSNYSMAVLPGESREYGDCDVEIQSRKIEPRPSIRGEIARVYSVWIELTQEREYYKIVNTFESWNATDLLMPGN